MATDHFSPREDAERLGYDHVAAWQNLIKSSLVDIAEGYKTKPDHLRWYAAMHMKEKHVHVHMVIFSTDPKEGYLTKQGIKRIKSALVRQVYKDDLLERLPETDCTPRPATRKRSGGHGFLDSEDAGW